MAVDQPLTSASLRLIGGGESPADAARTHLAATRAIAQANQDSAELDAADARWVFAVRVSERLDGGRAAVLTPENRRRLVDLSGRMGLRAFDANLVIAIVQDGARRGESIGDVQTHGRLRLIPAPGKRTQSLPLIGPVFGAAVIALGAVLMLIAWLTSAN